MHGQPHIRFTPFQLRHHVIRRQGGKEKAGKARHFLSLLALEEGKIEQPEKAVQHK